MSELKACPFCGVVPELETQHTIGVFYFYKCPNCAVSGGLGFDKNEAKNYWNTRPLEDALTAENAKLREALEKLMKTGQDIAEEAVTQEPFSDSYELLEEWEKAYKIAEGALK